MIISQRQFNGLWFSTIILMLFVQYVRPQEFIGTTVGFFAPVAGMSLLFVAFSNALGKTFAISQIRLVFLFFAWMCVLVPFSQSPGAAVTGLRYFLPLMPFVFSVVILVNDVKMLRKITDVFILLSAMISIIGLMTHAGGRYQMFGLGNFLTDPNDFALYMNVMLPVCFFMFMYEKENRIKQLFYLVAAVLALSSIVASFSRGGFLALLCVSLVMWWFSPNKKVTAAIGGVLLVGVILMSSNQWKSVVSTSFDAQQGTAQLRIVAWKASFRAFLDHPMGIGINNTPNTMYRYAGTEGDSNRMWGNVSHSFWFTALTEGGVVGFLLIVILLYHNTIDCLRMSRVKPLNNDLRFIKYFGYAQIGSLVGFCTAGTLLTVNYYPHLWYISALIASGSKILYTLEQEHSQ